MHIDEFLAKRPPAQREKSRPDPRGAVQEAVRIEALTNDPNFDYFLRYLEAAIKGESRISEQAIGRMRLPSTSDEEARQLRLSMLLSDARRKTLEEILMLPRLIKNEGEKARVMIAEMENDELPSKAP